MVVDDVAHRTPGTEVGDGPGAGQVVLAWRNLHLPGRTWSVRRRGSRYVGWRVPEVVLRDVDLRVQPAGRERARREGRKNVHAYVRGTVVGTAPDGNPVAATYTPFGDVPHFTLADGSAVAGARWARLDGGGLWLWDPLPPA